MEVVIIEKKTFEALLSGVETLTGKVGALCRRCNDKQMQKWLDGEEVCRLLRISPRTLQSCGIIEQSAVRKSTGNSITSRKR